MGCHGNHAFTQSQNTFFLQDKKVMYSYGLNEQFATHEKLSWGGGEQGMSY